MLFVHSGILVALFDTLSLYITTYPSIRDVVRLTLFPKHFFTIIFLDYDMYTPSDAGSSRFSDSLPRPLSHNFMWLAVYRVSDAAQTFPESIPP